MFPKLRIALISKDRNMADHLAIMLESKDYHVVPLTKISTVLGFIYSDPPEIVLIDLHETDSESLSIIRSLKEDSYFSNIPVIGLIQGPLGEKFEWDKCPLDDFICQPVAYPELFTRIALSLQRLKRVFDNNPLTKLPGNTSIQNAIEKALGKPMAVCYIDINNFKPYNDTYGFGHGDEVLRMVARIMSNAVRESGGGFAGHIGGDDFVFIVSLTNAESACKTIINNFNTIVPELFGEKEKSLGYYVARDRRGAVQKIPLLGISIGVVPTNMSKIKHAGMVAEMAAELKKMAKRSNESCYVFDKREECER